MVEVVAEKLKVSVKQFLEDVYGGGQEFSVATAAQHRKFLRFLEGKWADGAEVRAQTRSVKQGMEQQINLVGSKAIYDRVSYRLARLDITSDPFFNKEQLMLFKWRVEFFNNFFPIEAATIQYGQGLAPCAETPGWWHCHGAGALPIGPPLGLPWNDFYPQFALAGMAFEWVLHQAFHMGEDAVEFSQAWQQLPLDIKTNENFATYGGDFDFKYWLICDTPEEEEHVFKHVHSVCEETIRDGEGLPLSYLKQVAWALHSKGPPSLTELAIKKVLEFDLPLEDLPLDVLDMIEEGPQDRPLTERGAHLVDVLEQKDKKAMADYLLEEEEMASYKAKKVEAETDVDESIEDAESDESGEEVESDESTEEGDETHENEEEGQGADMI